MRTLPVARRDSARKELAGKLGVELKDLLDAKNSTAVTGTFLSGETPGSVLTGDEGWCRYAVGAPEHAHVLLHWNNPAAGDNTGDVRIAFPSGQARPDGSVVDFRATVAFAQSDPVTFPDDHIAPDGECVFEVPEKLRPGHRREGVVGRARYSVTQDPGHAVDGPVEQHRGRRQRRAELARRHRCRAVPDGSAADAA